MTSTSESPADLPPTAMLEPENSTPAIPEGAKSNPDNVSSLPRLPRKSPPVNAGRLIVLKIDLVLKQGEHSKANMNGSQTTTDRIGAIRRLRALDHVIAHFVVGPERHVTLCPTGAKLQWWPAIHWGSYYGHAEILKRDATRLVGDAIKAFLAKRAVWKAPSP
jgi:hypothetical protein